MAQGKYSPTVRFSYSQDQNWHRNASGENVYDPDGYDSYGYDRTGKDRAGYEEHEYFDDDDLYNRIDGEWCGKLALGNRHQTGSLTRSLDTVEKIIRDMGDGAWTDASGAIRILRDIDRQHNLAPGRAICENCDEEINMYSPTCPECGHDRTR